MNRTRPNPLHRLTEWGRRRSRKTWAIVAGVVLLLIVGRAVLPTVVERLINRQIAALPAFSGHVGDVDLHLWRGAYSLHEIVLNKKEGELEAPLLQARSIDFSVSWPDLFRGELVSRVLVAEPRLTYVRSLTDLLIDEDVEREWQAIVQELFRFRVTWFEITGGEMRFVDRTNEPMVDISLTDLRLLATGLRNTPTEAGEGFPARMEGTGSTVGGGRVTFFMVAEPLAADPHFELTMEIQDVSLPALNDILRAYAGVDLAGGTFSAYLEMAAKEGRFEGYVKPFFENLEFENFTEGDKSVGQRLWESLVKFTTYLIKNKPEDHLATWIPFAGEFEDAEVGVWATVVNLLRNGFVQALRQGFEGGVSADSAAAGGGLDSVGTTGRTSE